jgi:hypothetical protein
MQVKTLKTLMASANDQIIDDASCFVTRPFSVFFFFFKVMLMTWWNFEKEEGIKK